MRLDQMTVTQLDEVRIRNKMTHREFARDILKVSYETWNRWRKGMNLTDNIFTIERMKKVVGNNLT